MESCSDDDCACNCDKRGRQVTSISSFFKEMFYELTARVIAHYIFEYFMGKLKCNRSKNKEKSKPPDKKHIIYTEL
jgi:hypothetical protein